MLTTNFLLVLKPEFCCTTAVTEKLRRGGGEKGEKKNSVCDLLVTHGERGGSGKSGGGQFLEVVQWPQKEREK